LSAAGLGIGFGAALQAAAAALARIPLDVVGDFVDNRLLLQRTVQATLVLDSRGTAGSRPAVVRRIFVADPYRVPRLIAPQNMAGVIELYPRGIRLECPTQGCAWRE